MEKPRSSAPSLRADVREKPTPEKSVHSRVTGGRLSETSLLADVKGGRSSETGLHSFLRQTLRPYRIVTGDK